MTDYTAMGSADMVHECGDDASKWADAFFQFYPHCNVNWDVVMAWFANAIEHSHDVRTGNIINGEHAVYLAARLEAVGKAT